MTTYDDGKPSRRPLWETTRGRTHWRRKVTIGGGRKARQQKKEKRMGVPITEQLKDSNKHFSEHDIKMTSKHLKRCSILVIREM